MTLDQRLKALAMHMEVLSQVHADFEKRMTGFAAEVKDAINRLTNIAANHEEQIEDPEDG